jgi:ribosome biogenesis GTPase
VDSIPGIILKAQSGFFTVRTAAGDMVCQLRGKVKQKRTSADLATIGDEVTVSSQPDGTGMIESIAPRRSVLTRGTPHGSKRVTRGKEQGQVLIANPDQAVFVFACAEPAPHVRMLDRFLILAEVMRVPAVICANKADLLSPEAARNIFDLYLHIGYDVIYTSAATGAGVPELRDKLAGKLSVLAGPSGVGKSSLLNVVQPGLGIKTRAVSGSTSKGRHTTVHPELIPLDMGGYVADTPGIRALALWDVEPEELDAYFIEMRPLVSHCEFNDCTHLNESGCAIRKAVRDGQIAESRYISYSRLRAGDD